MRPEVPETNEKEAYTNDPVLNMLMGVYNKADEEKKREMNRSFFTTNGTEIRTTPKDKED